jgi:hypothetical protein
MGEALREDKPGCDGWWRDVCDKMRKYHYAQLENMWREPSIGKVSMSRD